MNNMLNGLNIVLKGRCRVHTIEVVSVSFVFFLEVWERSIICEHIKYLHLFEGLNERLIFVNVENFRDVILAAGYLRGSTRIEDGESECLIHAGAMRVSGAGGGNQRGAGD
jgi:hypothetical protein